MRTRTAPGGGPGEAPEDRLCAIVEVQVLFHLESQGATPAGPRASCVRWTSRCAASTERKRLKQQRLFDQVGRRGRRVAQGAFTTHAAAGGRPGDRRDVHRSCELVLAPRQAEPRPDSCSGYQAARPGTWLGGGSAPRHAGNGPASRDAASRTDTARLTAVADRGASCQARTPSRSGRACPRLLVGRLTEVLGEPTELQDLRRLTGGASRETWFVHRAPRARGRAAAAGATPPDPPRDGPPPGKGMAREAAAIAAAGHAGVAWCPGWSTPAPISPVPRRNRT